jgi:hypothetical protein
MPTLPTGNRGAIFAVPFNTGAMTTNPYDLFTLLAPAGSMVALTRLEVAQVSSQSATVEQQLRLQIFTGSTGGSTAAGVTPVNLKRWTGAATAGSSVTAASSGLSSTASAVAVYETGVNVKYGWCFEPDDEKRIVIPVSSRMHARVTAPSTALVLSGTLIFEEIGKPANT